MSTTYERLQVLLDEIQKNEKKAAKENPASLAESIVKKKLPALTITRNAEGVTSQPLSTKSITNLFGLLEKLQFVEMDTNSIKLTGRGQRALDDDTYANAVSVSTFELLSSFGVGKSTLYSAIDSIKPPNFPDAENIYGKLPKSVNKDALDIDLFRRLLFLLACAGSIGREVRVFYEH
jgi:hypothetical protein